MWKEILRDILVGAASAFLTGLAANAAHNLYYGEAPEERDEEKDEPVTCPLCAGEGEVDPSRFSVTIVAGACSLEE